MKPTDCNTGDLHRYFHNGFMLFEETTPVRVNVTDGVFHIRTSADDSWKKVAAKKLLPFYPESRAINYNRDAFYVARRARQQARRTASLSHYEIVRDGEHIGGITYSMMWVLCAHEPYRSVETEFEFLRENPNVTGRAVNPNIVITRTSEGDLFNINWKGQPAGYFDNGLYIPDYEGSCVTKLIRKELQEIYPSCL